MSLHLATISNKLHQFSEVTHLTKSRFHCEAAIERYTFDSLLFGNLGLCVILVVLSSRHIGGLLARQLKPDSNIPRLPLPDQGLSSRSSSPTSSVTNIGHFLHACSPSPKTLQYRFPCLPASTLHLSSPAHPLTHPPSPLQHRRQQHSSTSRLTSPIRTIASQQDSRRAQSSGDGAKGSTGS